MAVPKLAGAEPFYLHDPRRLTVEPAAAAEITVAAGMAPVVGVRELQPIDLIVCGQRGGQPARRTARQGGGYSDIEVALLTEAGLDWQQLSTEQIAAIPVLKRAASRLRSR